MTQITNKRQRDRAYNPSCKFCNDEGCPVCEPTIAQRFAERAKVENRDRLIPAAKQFIGERLGAMYPERNISMGAPQFCAFVLEAMEFAVSQRVSDEAVVVPTECKRFENLEIDR